MIQKGLGDILDPGTPLHSVEAPFPPAANESMMILMTEINVLYHINQTDSDHVTDACKGCENVWDGGGDSEHPTLIGDKRPRSIVAKDRDHLLCFSFASL